MNLLNITHSVTVDYLMRPIILNKIGLKSIILLKIEALLFKLKSEYNNEFKYI